jgi:head-tail adaptor
MRLGKAIGKRLGRLAKSSGNAKPGESDPQPARKANLKAMPLVNRLMMQGRPLPERLISPDAQGGIAASTLRAADHLLARLAVDKEREKKAEAPRTRWAFLPRPGMIVVVTVGGEKVWAKLLDWGPGGVKAVSKDGELHAAWADVRPARERELQAARRREDDDQEMQGANTAKYALDDITAGMRLTCLDDAEEPTEGDVVAIDPRSPIGGHVVLRTAAGRLAAFYTRQIVQVHGDGPEPVEKSMTITIDDGDEADEVEP